jgi:ATP-dependent RNA circularization protein (DNA/RNA ligase family)
MRMEFKYHRTYHLPYSEQISNDDKRLKEIPFNNKHVVVTEKLDGTNCVITKDSIHARSVDESKIISSHTKKLWGEIKYQIPKNFAICGEDIGYVHSIEYSMPTSFYVFSIYENKRCLSWVEIEEWCNLLGLQHVPIIYKGLWDQSEIQYKFGEYRSWLERECEGYVARLADSYNFDDSSKSIAKYVRKNHVQSNEMWYEHLRYNKIG